MDVSRYFSKKPNTSNSQIILKTFWVFLATKNQTINSFLFLRVKRVFKIYVQTNSWLCVWFSGKSGFNFYTGTESSLQDGLVTDDIPDEVEAWLTRPQFIPAYNTNSSSIWATLLAHLLWDEHPITEPQGEIALVLQASRYWPADCCPNNILHMNYSKGEGWNSFRTIKSWPPVYNDLLTRVTEHQFIWPHVVTAKVLRSSNQAQQKEAPGFVTLFLSHCLCCLTLNSWVCVQGLADRIWNYDANQGQQVQSISYSTAKCERLYFQSSGNNI